jgi:hypothetical protein
MSSASAPQLPIIIRHLVFYWQDDMFVNLSLAMAWMLKGSFNVFKAYSSFFRKNPVTGKREDIRKAIYKCG